MSGKVLYGKAPGNVLYRAAALVAGMALGAFLAVDVPTFILMASSNSRPDDTSFGFLLVILVIGLALMAFAYRTFRYGEQYEFGGAKFDLKQFTDGNDLLRVAMKAIDLSERNKLS